MQFTNKISKEPMTFYSVFCMYIYNVVLCTECGMYPIPTQKRRCKYQGYLCVLYKLKTAWFLDDSCSYHYTVRQKNWIGMR